MGRRKGERAWLVGGQAGQDHARTISQELFTAYPHWPSCDGHFADDPSFCILMNISLHQTPRSVSPPDLRVVLPVDYAANHLTVSWIPRSIQSRHRHRPRPHSVDVHYDNKCVLGGAGHRGVNVACLNVANCVYLSSQPIWVLYKHITHIHALEETNVIEIAIRYIIILQLKVLYFLSTLKFCYTCLPHAVFLS